MTGAGWRHDAGPTALAVALGLGIGWLDLHTTEVLVTVSALLLAGLALGFLRPRAAWRWAVPLALGLPAMAIVGHLLRAPTPEPVRVDPLIAVIAFVFASVGCYAGAMARRITGPRPTSG